MSEFWEKWEFSSPIEERIREFTAKLEEGSDDSIITQQWKYLKNNYSNPCLNKSLAEVLNETNGANCDIDGIISSTIEVIESGFYPNESKFQDLSSRQLITIFEKVGGALTDSGFTNFCKILSTWEDAKLLDVCFDYIIIQKLLEKEEATLSTIGALKELGRSKYEQLSRCIIKLLTNELYNFRDGELLEQVFDVLPDNQKEEIIRAIIHKDNFNENNWSLLQVLSFKTSTSLESIIMFMNSKCVDYADNQAFARFLVHICKNLQSDDHKEVLMSIIEKNRSLLKHQALKYISAA